jgi:5-methylcytosine-specific restriction protein A
VPDRCSRPCPGRGPRRGRCPNLIRAESLCPECRVYEKQDVKRYDTERGNSGERGYDARWQKVRDMKANRNPLCELCLPKIERPMDMVHHIEPIETHPELRLVMDNLLSVCAACHERIHDRRYRHARETT